VAGAASDDSQLFRPGGVGCWPGLAARRAYSRDLFDCIDLYRRLPEATARKIFSQVLSAVAYLQSQVRSVEPADRGGESAHLTEPSKRCA